MTGSQVYEWWMNKKGLDDRLVMEVQKQCFNKKFEPVRLIDYNELGDLLNNDWRFNMGLFFKWWWIFDEKYAVIDKDVLLRLLRVLRERGISNVWTIVAVVQSVTGLNCGFVGKGLGLRIEDGKYVREKEFDCFGFLVFDEGRVGIVMFKDDWTEFVRRDDYVEVCGFVVFD